MRRARARGMTLIEVMATTLVLLLGLSAALLLVTETARHNRRVLTVTQAQLIAEQELEHIVAQGCTPDPPCQNILRLDRTSSTLWQTASGELQRTAPPAGSSPARAFQVDIDVDGPGAFEGEEVGAPVLVRPLAGTQTGRVYNVRVSVSWQEPGRTGAREVVALQTRVAP